MGEEVKEIIAEIEHVPQAVSEEIAKDTKFVVEEIEKTPEFIVEEVKKFNRPPHFSLKTFVRKLGPGLITGASDDDPSGIGTYSSVGARFGYGQLWLAVYLLPLMVAVQEICARIGLVTDQGLAGTVKKHYGRKFVLGISFLLLIANTINIGADLGAMAASTQMLTGSHGFFTSFLFLTCAFTVVTVLFEILVPYRLYSKILKVLVISLAAYIIAAFGAHPAWGDIFRNTLLPKIHFNKEFIMAMVAVMGTTISPYLFFWQTSEEVEEHVEKNITKRPPKKVALEEIADMREDVVAGMGLANLIFFFIVVTTATVLFNHGITNIDSAQDAAMALKPLAGDGAYLLFTIGIIGTGLLAIPVLSGASAYALAETFNWNEGLYQKFNDAKGFYIIIALSTIVGLLLNVFGVNPIQALFWAAVVNGLIAPILLFVIMVISNDKKIMGSFTNNKAANFFGWSATLLMSGAAILLIFMSIF